MPWNWDNCVSYQQFNDQLLEDFAEVLAATDDPSDYSQVREAARCVGICLNDLTSSDKEWLNKKVNELREG